MDAENNASCLHRRFSVSVTGFCVLPKILVFRENGDSRCPR